MKVKRLISVITLVMVFALLFVPTSVSAASRPYKDVSIKTVGKIGYKSIDKLKTLDNAYRGVIKGKYFKPKKKVTKKEAIKVLRNHYGKKYVPVTKADKKTYKKTINYKWLYAKLSAISKKRGSTPAYDVSYSSKTKVTRVRMAITLAGLKDPYKDTTTKTVGAKLSAIKYIKAHKGYRGIIKGKYFKPKKKVTEREFIKVLKNLYGANKITISGTNKIATYEWAYKVTLDLRTSITGEPTHWFYKNKRGQLTRAKAADFLRYFSYVVYPNLIFKQ